jgi:uncharacterized protein involved in response to NO
MRKIKDSACSLQQHAHMTHRAAIHPPPADLRTKARATPRFALFNLGFRPFYLLASLFAAMSMLLWIAEYSGYLSQGYIRDPVWHAHEMLFGFVLAVVTGFLFTAVRNWTALPTPTGALLAAFALLWLAGRISTLLPFPLLAAVLNAAFPLAVAAALAVPLVRSANRRNYFFVALLTLIATIIVAVHAAQLGLVRWPARAGLQVGLDVVLFIIAVIAGRVVPMFTNNAIAGAAAARNPWIERIALAGVLALLVADALRIEGGALATLALGVAALHMARLYFWHPMRTRAVPLVWILHAAYAWIIVHLLLRALAAQGYVAQPFAIHALTIGAIGGMTIGMMTRTARGHCGRPLIADRVDVACYALIMAAAIVRVVGGIAFPELLRATVILSGLCWSLGFALYAIRYAPMLVAPRIDGKPG